MAAKTEKKPVKSSEQTEQTEQVEQVEQVEETDNDSGSGESDSEESDSDDESDSNTSEGHKSGTTVSEEKAVSNRKAVVFLGPHTRYSRNDTAWFDSKYAEELVERRIAVWPADAKEALAPRPGDDKYETDIG